MAHGGGTRGRIRREKRLKGQYFARGFNGFHTQNSESAIRRLQQFASSINRMTKTTRHTAEEAVRGRPPLPEEEAMVPVTVYMKPAQREKLRRLGGAPWVRERINQARER